MALGKLELHLEKKTLLKFCLIPGYPITLFRVFSWRIKHQHLTFLVAVRSPLAQILRRVW